MTLTIALLLDVVDRLGWRGERTDLLTYPEYVIFKGIDTLIDEKRIQLGLKLNVDALLFNPQTFIQIIERPINKGYNKPDTNKIGKEINKSRERNKTTEYRNNTKHPRDDDIWIRIKN